MESSSDWSNATPLSFNVGKNDKLTFRELLFPENLSTDALKIHLINRSIIKENSSKSKEELIVLFRQHVLPRPRRRDGDTLVLSNAVKAVSLKNPGNSMTESSFR